MGGRHFAAVPNMVSVYGWVTHKGPLAGDAHACESTSLLTRAKQYAVFIAYGQLGTNADMIGLDLVLEFISTKQKRQQNL